MVPDLRKAFNQSFTKEKYEAFLADLHSKHPGAIEFRVAETPVFIDKSFTQKLTDACESIIDVITDASFKKMTEMFQILVIVIRRLENRIRFGLIFLISGGPFFIVSF